MNGWLKGVLNSKEKQAMPVLSFPCVQLMGITVRELIADSDLQARGMKEVAARVPSAASVSMMDLSVEAESFGSTVRVTDDEVPTVIGRVIADEDGARALNVPDVRSGRTGLYIDAIGKAVKLINDRPVFAGVIGPYSLAGRLMDVSEIMINCYDEPDMVNITMEKTTEFLINYINEYKKVGANGIVMAEPLTGMLSPAMSEEFSTPYVKRIVDAVKDDDFVFIYHNCGDNTIKMVDTLMDIGADAYHFGNAIDMEEMLKAAPSDVPLMGNLDPSGVLRNGTPELVREKTLAMMDACCKYDNYITSSGCDIPPATPWANIDAFFAAVAEWNSRN